MDKQKKEEMIAKFRDMDLSKSEIKKVRIRDWGLFYFVDVEFFENGTNKQDH